MFKELFEAADRYVRSSDWKLIAVLKFCLVSLGIMVGIRIPKKNRKIALPVSFCVFLVSYFFLMARFYRVLKEVKE